MLQLQTKDKSLSQHFIERPASQNKNTPFARGVLLAERAGFEPANLFGLHAFQACALSQLRDLSF